MNDISTYLAQQGAWERVESLSSLFQLSGREEIAAESEHYVRSA